MDNHKNTKPRLAGRGSAESYALEQGIKYDIAANRATVAVPALPAICDKASSLLRSMIGGLL